MPLSQDELRTLVAKQRMKGKSATEQYGDPHTKGFKKELVDRLVQDRNREETALRFMYKLATLQLGQRINRQTARQTPAMQVILKRVYTLENDRLPALGPFRSFTTLSYDSYISPFDLGENNENQYTAPSQQRREDSPMAPIHPAPDVCISPLK